MKKIALCIGLTILCAASTDGHASAVDELLAQYQREGAGSFSAEQGRALLERTGPEGVDAEGKSCSACHTVDPREPGKHVKTGKAIEPLAPSANKERLQESAKVEKWFLRNCKGTLGRTCTPQEKGDFLTYLITLQ